MCVYTCIYMAGENFRTPTPGGPKVLTCHTHTHTHLHIIEQGGSRKAPQDKTFILFHFQDSFATLLLYS